MKKPKAARAPAALATPRSIVLLAGAGLVSMIVASRLPQRFLYAVEASQRLDLPIFPDLTSLTVPVAILRVATLFGALALGFVFWSSGRALSRALGLESSSRLESSSIALALGSLLWGQFFLALGLVGFLNLPLLRVLLVAGMASGIYDCFRRPLDFTKLPGELREAGIPWLSLLAVFLLVLVPYAIIPETFYDALEYHLALPALALLRGRIGPVPMNAFAGLPSIPSMLYGWALAIEVGGRVAHLLNFGFLAATILSILGLARRLGIPRLGGPAALLFAVAPCVVMMSVCTGVEIPGAFFLTTAIIAILGAVDDDRPMPWITAGLLIGAAMATKPLMWGLPAAALVAVWAAGTLRSKRGLGWAAAGTCIVFVPWLIKNVVFYGNPIYPFFHEWFRPHAEIMPNWRYLGENTRILWFSSPLAAFGVWLRAPFEAARYKGDIVQYADPLLIGLLPAGIWLSLRDRRFKILLCFTVAVWLPISLVTDLPRFFIPIFPALSLAAALAVQSCGKLLRGIVLLGLGVFAVTLWRLILPTERLHVFTGQQSESDFMDHVNVTSPGPLDAGARWINDNAPKDARVIIFGDTRGFQLKRDYFSSTPGQTTPLEFWANSSPDGTALHARLTKEKVKYIIINHAEIERLALAFSFTSIGESALKQFWAQYTRKVFQAGPEQATLPSGQSTLDRWVVVYEVLSDEEALKLHAADNPFAAYKIRVER
jgi:hypothetical protein